MSYAIRIKQKFKDFAGHACTEVENPQEDKLGEACPFPMLSERNGRGLSTATGWCRCSLDFLGLNQSSGRKQVANFQGKLKGHDLGGLASQGCEEIHKSHWKSHQAKATRSANVYVPKQGRADDLTVLMLSYVRATIPRQPRGLWHSICLRSSFLSQCALLLLEPSTNRSSRSSVKEKNTSSYSLLQYWYLGGFALRMQ